MFKQMDEQLLDAMCDCLKPVFYIENIYIVLEGDPVHEMLFIKRCELLSIATNGGKMGFFNSANLKAGDFCREELLTWALDPKNEQIPLSTRTVRAVTDVEAFAVVADEISPLHRNLGVPRANVSSLLLGPTHCNGGLELPATYSVCGVCILKGSYRKC